MLVGTFFSASSSDELLLLLSFAFLFACFPLGVAAGVDVLTGFLAVFSSPDDSLLLLDDFLAATAAGFFAGGGAFFLAAPSSSLLLSDSLEAGFFAGTAFLAEVAGVFFLSSLLLSELLLDVVFFAADAGFTGDPGVFAAGFPLLFSSPEESEELLDAAFFAAGAFFAAEAGFAGDPGVLTAGFPLLFSSLEESEELLVAFFTGGPWREP